MNNPVLLQKLVRGLEMSQGQFRLFLAQCNYLSQRQYLIQQLRDSFSGNLAELQLDESVRELYATIRKQLKYQQPDALIVWGLESVRDINRLLISMGLVREEFRHNCPFPIVLWIDTEISRQFVRLIPDFETWTSLTIFETSTDEFIDFIQKISDSVYQQVLEGGAGIFLDNIALGLGEKIYSELINARQELANQGVRLKPELEASLEFVLGRVSDHSTETALNHYQRSLELWQQLNNSVKTALTYYYLGLWWRSYAVRYRIEKEMACEQACAYFQQSIETFETIKYTDLTAKFINAWGEVLQSLKHWDQLETVANRALKLQQTYSYPFRAARAYGFLSEVELDNNNPKLAQELAQNALNILNQTLTASTPTSEIDEITLDWEQFYHQGWYLFSLAKSEQGLGNIKKAINILEQAKKGTKPEYDAELYIAILEKLRKLYYQKQNYLSAFKLKQEKQQIKQEFGFHAFIGANRLRDRQSTVNPALPQLYQCSSQQKLTQELAASGRQFDIQTLVEKLSRPDYKLIVIHGQSGVGKSSILQAGLIPTLEQKSIDTRDVVVVLQRIYVNWVSALGKDLTEQLQNTQKLTVNSNNLNSIDAIVTQLEHLEKNDELNILTVIIFDQFEEFFFTNSEPKQKREFAQFLQKCLNIPFVKIVLSLREDYIHYLLEFKRFRNLEVINDDILSKNILYYLGNFSIEQAKSVIQELTETSQFKIDADLTDKLVADLAQEIGEIRPIELQIVGAQLQAENITNIEKYQELGENPQAELVERYLAEVVRDCGMENEKLAWLVLLLLTDENNTRPLKTKAELIKEIEFDVDNLELVLKIFVDSGLVFLLLEKPVDRYQLVHDYLVSFIRKRKGSEILKELKQEREKRQQLKKWVFRGSVAASLVMTVLAVGMTMFGLQAKMERERAEMERIIAQANEARTLSISGNQWDGLITAMKLRQELMNYSFEPTDRGSVTTDALQVAVYKSNKAEFREFNRLGHDAGIPHVAFSPDGETIATASGDYTVKLWNFQGQLLQTLQGHQDWVMSVAFSPDGKTIVSASDDKTAKLWNLQGQLLQTLQGHQDWVNDVAFSPDGETIVTASRDKTAKLWNLQGQLLQTFEGHESAIWGVAFSPDGETIVTASDDKTAKLWNLQGQVLQTFEGHENFIRRVAFSPDGEIIATASHDKTAKLWNLQGQLLRTLQGHHDLVWGVTFSPDGETVATTSYDKTVKLWSLQGQLLQTLQGHENAIWGVAFSPDGETIATASGDYTVKLWNLQGQLLQTFEGYENPIWSVAFSLSKETIATASGDYTVKLWNLQGQLLQTFEGHDHWVKSVAFSPDGETIATASYDHTVKLWKRQGQLLQTFEGHESHVMGVAFSPDGKTIATASHDNKVKLWNLQGQLLQTFEGHEDSVDSVAFSPNGKTILSGSRDKTLRLWNLQGQLLQSFEGHESSVNAVTFSPDGKTIASASDDKTVKLWNLQGQLLQILQGHKIVVNGIAFSPDGKTIASVSDDKTVKLWNLQGQLLQTLRGHENSVMGVAFSPDGKTIVSASRDRTVKLWSNIGVEDLTELGCEWLNDYLITHPEELQDLKVCQTDSRRKAAARGWVIEGEKLARQGEVEEAITTFEKALKWNPDLNLDPKVKAESLAEAEKLMEEGTEVAREGKIEEAVEKYQKAIALDKVALIPTLQNIDPRTKAKYEASDALSDEGSDLVKEGKVNEAIASYKQAEKIDSTQISASNWNTLCWNGSLYKQAADVMFACEKAVALDPKDGYILDSRGLARALTGDIEGAIADFQIYVEWTNDEEAKAQRQEWIKALQAGENPFTDEVLDSLK